MAEDTQRLTRDIEATRGDLTRDLDALTDRVSPGRVVERRVERTKSGAGRLKDRVMGTVSDVKGSAAGTVGSATSGVAGTAHDVAGSASGAASQTTSAVRDQASGNPVAAGVIAFGIGWLISSLMPVSAKETQAAQTLLDAAKEHGQPLADQAKQVGQDVASSLQDKAQDAAQSVSATAKDSATHVADEAKDNAQTVAQDAKDAR